MVKSFIDREYQTLLTAFVTKVMTDRLAAYPDPTGYPWEFFIGGTGRKYDKVIQKEATTMEECILYMVVKRSGNIYGARTPFRPNFLRYFGNLSTASRWDWSNTYGVPISDSSVQMVKQYGDVPHFIPTLDNPSRRSYLQETQNMTHPLSRQLLSL